MSSLTGHFCKNARSQKPSQSGYCMLSNFQIIRANENVCRIQLSLSIPLQAFCFVSSFSGDLIPPEAVMKLRQKNPLTVRIADEDRGEVVQDSNLLLSPSPIRLASVSSHLASFCRLVVL